uniref:uncharacterized protein LOC105351282 n=1 Tax=Fragaria vesca subsp. vesca TaxID=101020 RepID=UPI0005C94BA6|nr:PREDICTED: uncharacterized protein LOC105351282 [Fragaria vesca subsp. vesca]
MNVLCWKCQGIRNPSTVDGLKGIIPLTIPDIVFLSESRCLQRVVERLKREVGLKNFIVVDCDINQNPNGRMSRAGGICLLWKEDVEVSLLSFSKNHIDVWVGGVNSASRWRFTGLYGFSKAEDRHKTWALLPLKVSHLKPSKSDHLSILVEIRSVQVEVRRKKKRWRFEGYWLQDEECGEMVRRGWQSSECVNDFMKVCQKINNTRKVLGEWSKLKFGILKKEIELTRSKLAVFYEKAQGSYREEECKVLQDKLNDLHLHEQQRAKVMWLVDGDQNTSYFHQKVCNRKRKNTIKGLFNEEGVWCSRDSELEEIVLGYYGSLFTTSSPKNMDIFASLFQLVVTSTINEELKEFSQKKKSIVP